MEYVQLNWYDLASRLRVDDTRAMTIWNIIAQRYSESSRFYHNLNHILDLIQIFEENISNIVDHDCVLLSIYFHDIVYDPKSGQNEEESVKLLKETFNEQEIPDALLEKVSDYILATKSHQGAKINDADLLYFLDFDISVLGRSRAEYSKYSYQIRQEYAHVPHGKYCEGRATILKRFLYGSDRIYATDNFAEKLEMQARDNLRWEIDLLEAGTIPSELT